MSNPRDTPDGVGGAGPESASSGGIRSTLRDPVGPKGRGVYMRRRLAVLAVLLAVIAVVVLVLVRPGSGDAVPAAGEVSVPKDLQNSEKNAPPEKCSEDQLSVTAVTDKDSYAPDEMPHLSLTVENTGTESCSADVGTSGMEFEIESGSDRVWFSKHCQKDPKNLLVILDPGQPETTKQLEWERVRSSDAEGACDAPGDEVGAGGASYHVWAKVAGVRSEASKQIVLE